jgi:hypothetical protein
MTEIGRKKAQATQKFRIDPFCAFCAFFAAAFWTRISGGAECARRSLKLRL